LSPNFRGVFFWTYATHPELPWQQMMGVGNVDRQDYDNVQHDFVWRTVQERLPALLATIEEEIALATVQMAGGAARNRNLSEPRHANREARFLFNVLAGRNTNGADY